MTAGFASTTDAAKRNAEIQRGSVRIGSSIVPARRLGNGAVQVEDSLHHWHDAPHPIPETFRKAAQP